MKRPGPKVSSAKSPSAATAGARRSGKSARKAAGSPASKSTDGARKTASNATRGTVGKRNVKKSAGKRTANTDAGTSEPPAPLGRRAQNKESTKENIVNAALSLFQSKGFEATSTKEIAQQAGIAEGTIFNYFKTKDDIALHFFEMEVDRSIEAVRSKARLRNASLEEKLFALVQSQFEYLAPYEKFIGSALVEALKPASKLGPFSHKAIALRHRYIGFVEELFEESLPPKTLGPLTRWAPDAFWIYYLGALLYWLHDTSPRKQNTLAFLDRSLKMGVALLKRAT